MSAIHHTMIKGKPYDAEVEYLYFTPRSGAYIDTMVPPPQRKGKWEIDIKLEGNGQCRFIGYGALDTSNAPNHTVVASPDYGNSYFPFRYAGTWIDDRSMNINDKVRNSVVYEFESGRQIFMVNGVVKSQNSIVGDTTTQDDDNIRLFTMNKNNKNHYATRPIYLYGLRIEHDGVIVRDYKPVRYTDEEGNSRGGLYDNANPSGGPLGNGLYPNIGTGSFSFGSDI